MVRKFSAKERPRVARVIETELTEFKRRKGPGLVSDRQKEQSKCM